MSVPEQGRKPVLELRGISKRFGAVQALSDVDLEVYPGEVVALVGDNGAGKSTLIKVISGTYQADAGQYVHEGEVVSVTRPRHANDLGIQTVYQDLALCDNLDVVANLYLGRETVRYAHLGPLAVIDEVAMEQRSMDFVEELHVRIPSLRSRIATLSGGAAPGRGGGSGGHVELEGGAAR